jgi:hypothetical protein
VILQQIGPFINGLLLGILADLLLKSRIGLNDINQFGGQIILGPLIVVLSYGGTHLGRRNGEHSAHEPVRTAPVTREPHEFHILIGNPTEETMDIFRFQRHGQRHGFPIGLYFGTLRRLYTFRECQIFPFSIDLVYRFLFVLVGLPRSTTVLGLLTAPCNPLACLNHHLPTGLALGLQGTGIVRLVNQEFPTLETYASQNLHGELEELGVVYGPSQREMAEMAGTIVVVLTTCTTDFPILQNTHTRVKESTELAFGGGERSNLTHRPAHDLFRTEDTELNAHNGLGFGRMWQEWHVSM